MPAPLTPGGGGLDRPGSRSGFIDAPLIAFLVRRPPIAGRDLHPDSVGDRAQRRLRGVDADLREASRLRAGHHPGPAEAQVGAGEEKEERDEREHEKNGKREEWSANSASTFRRLYGRGGGLTHDADESVGRWREVPIPGQGAFKRLPPPTPPQPSFPKFFPQPPGESQMSP